MKRFAIAAALITFGSSAFAAVNLTVDDYIKVTAINGQAINQSPFQPLKKQFTLDAGRHVITARYDRLFELNGDNHDYLKSGDITVTAELSDNQSYRLTLPNQPERYSDAKEYAKAPTLAIVQGNNVITSQTAQSERGGLLTSLTGVFGRNDTAVLSNQQAIAAINTNPQTTTTTRPSNTLDSFMQLWLNASDEEREKIRQWIQQ